jgi:hypothetical protein
MTVPTPPIKLTGHCSVIHGNTLYAYSPNGFASIPLKQNGNWTELGPPKAKVTGAACVTGAIEGNENDEGLYVIGGTGASSDYSGLQRYSFADKKWSTLQSSATSMTNRLYHGAGYLKSNSTILVYGGSVGTNAASSSTFLISTTSPYDISSRPDQGAPAASEPMLLPWSESEVALVGGSTDTAIYVYSELGGWVASGASLPAAVPSSVHCALVNSGSSKVLETFHMDSSPNTVVSYALVNDGQAASPAGEVGASSGKRSMSDYPTYNSTFAPTSTRSDYALAQGDNLVVLSSGQSDSSLAIFNSTSNGWVNATELFYGSGQQHTLKATTTSTTSTTSTTPTATSSPTATSHTTSPTPAAAASGSGSSDYKTIIGATLGSVCGLALILLAILFLLKREKRRRQQNGQSGSGENKDRLSFQDQGIEPLADGAYPMARSPVPVAAVSNDSLAIMSGRATGEKSLMPPPANVGYGLAKGKSSPLSTIPSSGVAPSSMYSEDVRRSVASTGPGNQPGDRTTDEGWGKYFQNSNATNLAGMQTDRSTVSSVYTKSDYRGSAWPMSNLTPLNFAFLDQPKPLGRVHSGSPTTADPSSSRSLVIPEGQSARISSADSISLASDDDPHDTNWTGAGQNSWLGRPTSSNYTTSFYNSSTHDISSQAARQSHGRRSSVIIPDDIDELPIQGRNENVNSDMSWLNLQAGR